MKPLGRAAGDGDAHVALNRVFVRTLQRTQLVLEINVQVSSEGVLQTLLQTLFFALDPLAVTNQIALLHAHRVDNRLQKRRRLLVNLRE